MSIITITATRENSMLTKANTVFCSGKIYLGRYTFLINDAPLITDVKELEVASDIKLKISAPRSALGPTRG